MKRNQFLLLCIFCACLQFSFAQTKEVCFLDAGAGIVRYDFLNDTYSFACFSDIFFPDDVAYDPVDNWLYWTAWTTDRIYRCRPNGTEIQDPIQGVSHSRGIVINTQDRVVYWAENINDRIRRYDIQSKQITTLINGIDQPEQIALDQVQHRLFVAAREGIYVVYENGTQLTLLHSEGGIKGIEYDPVSDLVYFTSHTTKTIKRMTTDGSNIETIGTVPGLPDALSIDHINKKIYWTDWESATISRAELNGTSKITVAYSDGNISGVFVDPGTSSLFWADQDKAEIHRAGIWGDNDTILIEGETWKWLRDYEVSLVDDKLFVINDFTDQIVRTDKHGYNPEVILDSVPGATRFIFDQYSQKLYWTDYFEECINETDVRLRTTRKVATNVYAISMDIDYLQGLLYFVDQLTKTIKTYNLYTGAIKTINVPFGKEPKELGIQHQRRNLFWIDNNNEVVYRHPLGSTQHLISFDEDGESISDLDPGLGNDEIFYIHSNLVNYGNSQMTNKDSLRYPGTVFISSVKVTDEYVPIEMRPGYRINDTIVCEDDLGSVTVTVYGAIPPVTYTWSDGFISNNDYRTGLLPSVYQVTVTDVRDSSLIMEINFIPENEFVDAYVITENAVGGNNGSATATITGGMEPYTILWVGNNLSIADQLSINNLSPGEYHLIVTDHKGCQIEESFVIELESGVSEISSLIRVVPNPASNYISVEMPGSVTGSLHYQLFNMSSGMIQQGRVEEEGNIDISLLLPGIYNIKLFSQKNVYIYRFIKL